MNQTEALVADLAAHGIRFDLNPTVDLGAGAFSYITYIGRIDQSIRERATAALATAESTETDARLTEALEVLAHIVSQANVNPVGKGDFIERYNMPVGSIHKAIPFLARHGIVIDEFGAVHRSHAGKPRVADHEIVWTHDRDTVTAGFVCNNLECEFRWSCPEDCEILTDQEKTEDGYRHRAHESYTGLADVWHTMVPADCNFATWMTADPYMIPELNESQVPFEIGRTAVMPVWNGQDSTTWQRPEDCKPAEIGGN